jgi:hypothetical protein
VVFKHTGVSGIRWFLWDSQFGRFSSSSYIIRTDGDKFFFLHTLLWAFAPWALLFYTSLFLSIKKIVKGIPLPEYIMLSGAIPMLLIFSVSQFQLPFYTNILFPFFAIITAVYIQQAIENHKGKLFKIVQYIITGALIILIIALDFVFAPEHSTLFIVLSMVFIVIALYLFKTTATLKAIFLFTCCVAVWANAYVVAVVYPDLVRYKGDVQAAAYINTHMGPDKQIAAAFEVPDPFEFYTKRKVSFIGLDSAIKVKNKDQVILVEDTLIAHLVKRRVPFKLVQKFDNYPNEVLIPDFLIEKHRYKTLNHYFLITL